ncbi:anti-sigma factor family protein [Pseudoxanthomonas composti]|uniref:Anti-sigma factor n=1 Tax=Pseudoxanthomonas composti TaxID=2137479 RepID=A0A4Q1JVC1_9GAMM|nr:anti-sigma factor [Pseudoxanthomonas composti]RXR06091.1 anti-sigma factor [Pseudoxanthomonas composti]
MNALPPSEDELHALVDDQLDPQRRGEVEDWLAHHPHHAEQVQAWKLGAEQLRVALVETRVQAPAQLDPARVRRQLRARRRTRLGVAAALVLAVAVGGMGGWQMRTLQAPQAAQARLPMADAVAAYRLFATQGAPAPDFPADDHAALQRWLSTHFGQAGSVPDLQTQGFSLQGARLVSTEQGPAALLLYDAADGARIGVYLRPGGYFRQPGERTDGPLLAQYWSRGQTSFAVVSAASDSRARALARHVARDG